MHPGSVITRLGRQRGRAATPTEAVLDWPASPARCSRPRHKALERGIAPIAVGLVAASVVIIALSVDHTASRWALSAAAVLSTTRINPIYVVLGGGAGLWIG